jgi:elongation of very long chain fatty acids protein 4
MAADPKPQEASSISPSKDRAERKSKRKVDRSAGFFRTVAICVLYAASLSYGLVYGPRNDSPGGHFVKGGLYDTLLADWVIFGLPACYVIAVMLACRYMRDKAPKSAFLKSYVQPVYNIAQIVLCTWMTWGLLPQVDILNGNPFGLNYQRNASIEFFVFIHYLSKYMDWTDTFIMIGNKSFGQVSFLQVFHHATIGMVWAVLLSRGWGSGTAAYGAFINSVTHVLLYGHYFWTSLGYNNPFKAYLTKFQLAQFASCILHAVLVLVFEKVYPLEFAYLQVGYHIIMLYLFGKQMAWAPVWCTGHVPDIDGEAVQKTD